MINNVITIWVEKNTDSADTDCSYEKIFWKKPGKFENDVHIYDI